MKLRDVMNVLENYTQHQFEIELSKLKKALSIGVTASPSPKAFLLGGQSGAGKSTLHKIIKKELDGNVIVVNGDEYRKLHPRFRQLDAAYGKQAVEHTAKWAGAMTEALVDALSREGYNLVVEGTLRTSAVPMKTAQLLRDRGYAVSLALMAVKPEISLVSCQLRYEQMRLAGTTPRATDPAHHNAIVHDIAGNLAALEQSGLFDEVRLYDRAKRLLYPAPGAEDSAADALHQALFGPYTPEEQGHLAALKRQLERLKSQDCAPGDDANANAQCPPA